MSNQSLCNTLEAVLLAAGRPVSADQLAELFDERERPTAAELRDALSKLGGRYEGTGIELREVASGWRIQVRPRFAGTVSRLWQERPSRYSRALLETLALIAYRQPITRGEIEDIRGVTVAATIMRTLQERNWVRVVGHREVPGRPELLGTTRDFLDYFGLKSLDELPTLAQLQDLDELNVQLELPEGLESLEEPVALPSPTPVREEFLEDDAAADDELEAADGHGEEMAPTLVASPPDDPER
jgi:segregation and condensation protein B